MSRRLREDLTVLIPSLRAYAFCLLLNHTHADIRVEEALVELWSQAKGKTMPGLKLRAFQIVRKTCLMRAKIENGGAKLVHGSGWIVLLRAV